MASSTAITTPDRTPGDGAGPAGSLPARQIPFHHAGRGGATARRDRKARSSGAGMRERARSARLAEVRGTALMLRLPRPEETTAGRCGEGGRAESETRQYALTPAAVSMIAVLLGAAIGSGATAGLLHLGPTPGGRPRRRPYEPTPQRSAESTTKLATLKASIEGSAKQSNTQIAKIADRLDRAEKAQTETSNKLARTTKSLDRIDHRLAANGAAGEATGSLPSRPLLPRRPIVPRHWPIRRALPRPHRLRSSMVGSCATSSTAGR